MRQPQVSAAARLEIARRVASACEEIGFFAVTGYGVPGAVIADLVTQSYALNQRPLTLDPASGRPTGGHERSQSAPIDRHVLSQITMPLLPRLQGSGRDRNIAQLRSLTIAPPGSPHAAVLKALLDAGPVIAE
jgi:non-haem dioxygenase in morphine synthesis N-terminal